LGLAVLQRLNRSPCSIHDRQVRARNGPSVSKYEPPSITVFTLITVNYRQLGRVLVQAWPVGLVSAGIFGCWGLAYLGASNLTEQVLYSGTWLQAFGLMTVATGISQLRSLFGKPSLIDSVTSWFLLLIGAFRKPLTINADGLTSGSALTIGGLTAVGPTTSKITLKMRVAALEKSLDELREQHGKSLSDLKDNLYRVESLVQDEGDKRQSGDLDISKRLEEVAVGGIHLEMVGLVWLLLGMLGTSIPKEFAKLFWL